MTATREGIREMRMREDVQEAVRLAHEIAARQELWPGWRFAAIPLALHGGGEGFLIGHPAPPAGYESVGEMAGRPVYHGPALPEMASNTATVVAGHLTALAMLPPTPLEAAEPYARLLLHEAFHAFQRSALADPGWTGPQMLTAMGRYPEHDPPNNALAIVENRLLAAALAGDEGALPRFLAVRRHRQGRLERRGMGELVGYEQFVEYNEGTPTYIEVRAGMDPSTLQQRLDQCNRGGKWAAYQRFYYTGAALVLLLDRLLPGWQERFRTGGVTLQSLVASAVTDPLPAVARVLEAHGFGAILAEEERLEAERQGRLQSLLAELWEGEGLRVEIMLPPTAGAIWDPRSVMTVSPGARLHTTHCGASGLDSLRVQVARLCLEEQGEAGRKLMLRLPEPPVVKAGGRFTVSGPGLQVDAPAGRIEEPPGEGVLRIWLT